MPTTVNDPLSLRVRRQLAGEGEPFLLDVEFAAENGFTILFGASGSGKTTVLDCIAGLQRPDAGRIQLGAHVLFDSSSSINLSPNRRSVGYLVQSLAMFPHMTVLQNVQYGLHAFPKAERERRSGEILESFRIGGLAQRRPQELSGGERQRAALARTLVTQPRALLLDEPLTGLDAITKAQIVSDLRAWSRQHAIPILYVTHHREEAFALGEQVLVLDKGRLVASGSPHDVFHRPELESVAQLVGFENVLEATFIAAHPEDGTMTCRVKDTQLDLEAPLTRVDRRHPIRLGIRAGDIMLASAVPQGLSARNVFPGRIAAIDRRGVMVIVYVNVGAQFEVHITPAACAALMLEVGSEVWLVLKTYSCQVLQNTP